MLQCIHVSVSLRFLQAESKRAALESAIKVHTRLTREAATGKGIDRHLMGLQLVLRPELREHAPLFDDPLFGKSSCWKLCTSGLSAGPLFRGTGCVGFDYSASQPL